MPTLMGSHDDEHLEDLYQTSQFIYGDGLCYELAVALNEGLGWPMVGLMDGEIIRHACVRSPDGRLFDVRGYITEQEFGQPYLAPPHILRDITIEDLRAIRPVSRLTIDHARRMAETHWPDMPWLDSLKARTKAFLDELETLCQQHNIWVWGSSGSLVIVSPGDGSEDGYHAKPVLECTAYYIERIWNHRAS